MDLQKSETVVPIQFLEDLSNTKTELLLLPFQSLPQWCLPIFSGAGAEKHGDIYHSNEDTSAVCLRTFYKRFLLLIDLPFCKFTGVFLIALLKRILSQTELQRTNGSSASTEFLLSKLMRFLFFFSPPWRRFCYSIRNFTVKKKKKKASLKNGKKNPITVNFNSRKKNVFLKVSGIFFPIQTSRKISVLSYAHSKSTYWTMKFRTPQLHVFSCPTWLYFQHFSHITDTRLSTAQTPTSTKLGTQFCSSSLSIPSYRFCIMSRFPV